MKLRRRIWIVLNNGILNIKAWGEKTVPVWLDVIRLPLSCYFLIAQINVQQFK